MSFRFVYNVPLSWQENRRRLVWRVLRAHASLVISALIAIVWTVLAVAVPVTWPGWYVAAWAWVNVVWAGTVRRERRRRCELEDELARTQVQLWRAVGRQAWERHWS